NANPGGRPKGRSLTALLRHALETGEITTTDAEGRTKRTPIQDGKQLKHLIIETLVERALKGDFHCLKLLFDRHDGKQAVKIKQRREIMKDPPPPMHPAVAEAMMIAQAKAMKALGLLPGPQNDDPGPEPDQPD